MNATSTERRFEILCEIMRAQHFAWRETVRELCPDRDPKEFVDRMWRLVGRGTAQSYSKRIDAELPLAQQIATRIAYSSQCMGESVRVEAGDSADEALVCHDACPWCDWHTKLGLLDEDRPGCDRWFQSTLDALSDSLGVPVTFETLSALPEGDASCVRRIRVGV